MYKLNFQHLFLLLSLPFLCSCQPTKQNTEKVVLEEVKKNIITGAERLDQYLPLLEGKKVGLLVNHTSLVGNTHLLDTLIASKIEVAKVFAPEHGFRGKADAGEKVNNEIDAKTGVPLVSMYGNKKKPTPEQMAGLDIVIFDMQDVGARFFTYFSAMQYMMEACAENGIDMLILDRPNPNGHYVDGPILDLKNKSYVGLNPIPIVHGLTAAEYAKMIVGEQWIDNGEKLKLSILEMENWDHQTPYSLPVKPSPNLPNDQSIALYPSVCLFEGTIVSVGRGTYDAFQVIGLPDSTMGNFSFTPKSIDGMSKYPPYQDKVCYGVDLRKVKVKDQLDLSHIIDFYNKSKDKEKFFNNYFVKLAGIDQLQKQIEAGLSENQIRASWQDGLEDYKNKRSKYLLYD
ncbi:MAG: DUF1343 domain-containing protein [Cyclobacteriaceae bacterium]